MTRVAHALFAVALAAWLIWLMSVNLGALPGLHGDEAYFAIRAVEMARGERFDAHGMNGYSGSLFPWLASLAFAQLPSLASVRGVSVAANVLALLLGALLAVRASGRAAAAWCFLLLAASSTLFTFDSRIAWEVTALNPLLATCAVAAAMSVLARSVFGAAVLLIVSLVGVFNHVIFLHLCIAFAVSAVWTLTVWRTENVARLVVVSAINVFTAATFALVKLMCHAHGIAFGPVTTGAAVVVVCESLVLRHTLEGAASALVRFAERRANVLRSALRVFFALGGVLFGVFQLPGFAEVFSGAILVERFYSQPLPLLVRLVGFCFTALVFVLYARAVRIASSSASLVFLTRLPIAIFCSLPLLVGPVVTIRYFVLGNFVLLIVLAVLLAKAARLRLLTTGALVYAATLALFISPMLLDPNRLPLATPREFHVGHQKETSRHFLQILTVVERLRADEVEHVVTSDDFFIGLPIRFYRMLSPWKLATGRWATVDYDASVPGGYRYQLNGRR